MFSNISIGATSAFFMLILMWSFFRKKHIQSKELDIFKGLIVLNFIGLVLEIVLNISVLLIKQQNIIIDILGKLLLVYFLLFTSLFLIYTFTVSLKEETYKKNKNYITTLICILVTICIILIVLLPINFKYVQQPYSYGPAVDILYVFAGIEIITIIAILLINFKRIKKVKLLPLIIYVIGTIIATVIQKLNPALTLSTFVESILLFIMYHTIENPDVKMLEEVSIAKEQAEKANTAKSEFLSNMSHEIRTPLNAIVGFSESLKEDKLTDESREKVNDIITASQNLLEIVNGILDISKIEANKLEIINKEYEPAEMFKELISLTRARIGDKGLDFQVNIDETIPSVLYGDNARIKQIILNILTNAVKYTKEGYVTFTVSSVLKDNVCRLIISVEDSGIGIKQESISKLFSKFERLNVEKQLTIEGTGLGLAITKKLLDLMNGTIIVQSIYGQGSKFTISIDQRIISLDKPLDKQPAVSQSTIVDANGAKLLIVDDNEMNIKVAMTLLKKYHFDIDYCNSGLACLAKIRDNQKFDIILLDDMMPRMSGKETLAKLKEEKGFNTPVIALTANALTGMKEEYLNAGFNDYLSKPIEKPELERVIKEFIMKDTKENINSETSKATTSILEKQMKEVSIEPPKNILIIDSNVYSAKILTEILNQFNVTVTSAKTGEEAIISVIDKTFDLILLDDSLEDIKVPKMMSDFASIAGFNSPVVLMSKQTEEEIKQIITKNNLSGYISKPINNIEVENMYASIIKKD